LWFTYRVMIWNLESKASCIADYKELLCARAEGNQVCAAVTENKSIYMRKELYKAQEAFEFLKKWQISFA
jgi:hypothetical protein